MSSIKQVAIIGGGISGLAAARYLQERNISFTLFEKSKSLGGRIKTHKKEGFLMDEGFQVLLDSYEEVSKLISFDNLKASKSPSGAMIRVKDAWHKMGNPLKNIGDTWSTLMNPAGSIKDKWLIFTLSQKAQRNSDPWTTTKNISTIQYLEDYGFSKHFINHFFKPFFGGVFLDYQLKSSARLFMYLFGKFNSGDATLPQNGMGDLISEIAKGIPPESIQLKSKITAIQGTRLTFESGESKSFDKIIDARNAQKSQKWNGTRCLYFTCDRIKGENLAYLHLNPMGKIIRHVAILNRINPNYSPEGKDLLSVTLKIEDNSTETEVAKELEDLFPSRLQNLSFLDSFDIPESLPVFSGELQEIKENDLGQIIIGDSVQYPSINGAIASGRKAATII